MVCGSLLCFVCTGQMFPTLQLSISGFCLSLEPVVLEFLQLLSFHSLHALSVIAAHPDAATSSSCPNKTMMQMDLPYTLTPTASVADEEEDGNWEHWTGEQNSILSAAKLYAVKVCLILFNYMCLHVCVYVYLYAYMCVYICVYIYICVYV